MDGIVYVFTKAYVETANGKTSIFDLKKMGKRQTTCPYRGNRGFHYVVWFHEDMPIETIT